MSKDLISSLEKISKELQSSKNFVLPNLINRFEENRRQLSDNIDSILNKERDLKIGIVGTVKAGKSSFLNALIFEGDEILPKAATPMTASLTKINYSDENSAKIVFFSESDWQEIENLSKKYDEQMRQLIGEWVDREYKRQLDQNPYYSISKSEIEPSNKDIKVLEQKIDENIVSCHQIFSRLNGQEQLSFLGKEQNIPFTDVHKDLVEFVGAEGKYTNLVKYIELKINNPLLKGLEIIDTPGLGDPLMSRCMKTKEFLISCDVVFLLSSSTQFLTAADMALLVDSLPEKSIAKVLLLGTRFDSAILDTKANESSIIKIARNLAIKFSDRAEQTVREKINNIQSINAKGLLLRLLNTILMQKQSRKTLYFTSSILYSSAKKILRKQELIDYEEHILSQLSRYEGMKRDSDFLLDMSAIPVFKEHELKKLIEEKEQIIEQRCSDLCSEQKNSFASIIDDIQSEAEQHLHILLNGDIEEIKKNLEKNNEALTKMHKDIKSLFETFALDTSKYLSKTLNKMKCASDNFSEVKVEKEVITKNREETSGHLWWRKTERWVETITNNVVSIGDLDKQIRDYFNKSEKILADDIELAVNVHDITENVKRIVLQAFTKANIDFNPDDILIPLQVTLSKIKIPPLKIGDPYKYCLELANEFPSAKIANDDIHSVQHAFQLVINKMQDDLTECIKKITNEICNVFNDSALTFTDDMKECLKVKANQLEESLKNKESNIQYLNLILSRLVEYKKEIIAC